MVFWSDENGPKIRDFWKKFQNRPVWPVLWARKPKIVTHHYQLTLGNPPVKGLEVSWFLGLRIILLIQHISVKKQIFPHFSPNYNPLCYVYLQINLFEKTNNFRGDKKEVKLSNKKLSATLSVTQQFFSYSHVYICNNTYEGTMLILFILLQSSLVKETALTIMFSLNS